MLKFDSLSLLIEGDPEVNASQRMLRYYRLDTSSTFLVSSLLKGGNSLCSDTIRKATTWRQRAL